MSKQKLELTWIGKEKRPKLEPRILLEDPDKSYHAKHRMTASDIFDNRLIFGDNLLALKALEQEFTGKVKCVYIDRSEEHTSELQSLMRISYAVFCLKKKKQHEHDISKRPTIHDKYDTLHTHSI